MELIKIIFRYSLSFAFTVLAVFTLQGCNGVDNKDSPYQEGVHYRILKGLEKTDSEQVILFFSAACPHCKKFDEYLKGWEQQRNSHVTYERVPVTFNKKDWTLLSKIYAVGRQLGEQDKVIHALFKSVQEDRVWWTQDYEVIQWFGYLGFDLATVDELWKSPSTTKLMERYSMSEGRFAVRSIPRLIINGKYELITKAFEDAAASESSKPSIETQEQIRKAIDFILKI